jgi:trk system potassium uptake protein TrkA
LGRRRDFLVIGMGRFGRPLAEELVGMGQDVLAVDVDARLVQACSESVTRVVQADAREREALRQLGASDFSSAIVAIGTDVESSILTTYALVDLKVPRIWAKAITYDHGQILRRIGADRVVFPERDMGVRVAHSMLGRTLDYIELEDGFVLLEATAPKHMFGMALADAKVRSKHNVTIVAIKVPGGKFTYATPETVVTEGDLLVVAGQSRDAEAFAALD